MKLPLLRPIGQRIFHERIVAGYLIRVWKCERNRWYWRLACREFPFPAKGPFSTMGFALQHAADFLS